jgi:hypothetical protein
MPCDFDVLDSPLRDCAARWKSDRVGTRDIDCCVPGDTTNSHRQGRRTAKTASIHITVNAIGRVMNRNEAPPVIERHNRILPGIRPDQNVGAWRKRSSEWNNPQ